MTNDLQQIKSLIDTVAQAVNLPFWKHGDFWIGMLLGVLGVAFSVGAFVEAGRARRAATQAGKTVKIQTVVIELNDVLSKLQRLDYSIRYTEARDTLNDATWRLRRSISAFEKHKGMTEKITELKEALSKAKDSLNKVRPTDASQTEIPGSVYLGIENDFAAISGLVADLQGLFEKETIDFGEKE